MKKQKVSYRYFRYEGNVRYARREISFEIKLSSQLILDELCYKWNEKMIESAINRSIDTGDKEKFIKIAKQYKRYLWE